MGLTLLATTHRVAPGLLTWRAWDALRSAPSVRVPRGHPLLPSLRDAGIEPEVVAEPDAARLVADAREGDVLWVAAPDGDEALMREIGALVVNDRWRSRSCTGPTTCPARGCSTSSR